MNPDLEKLSNSIQLLKNSLPEALKLPLWCYSLSGSLLGTDCHEKVLFPIFEKLNGLQKVKETVQKKGTFLPIVIGSSIGLNWAVVFEHAQKPERIYVLGPAFHVMPQKRTLQSHLPSASWASDLLRVYDQIETVPYGILQHYALMLHNLLHQEQLGPEIFAPSQDALPSFASPDAAHDRVQVYQAEQAMLSMVREGDIHYSEVLLRSASLSPGVPIHGRDPLRQAKTSCIVFTSLVCRAAMEGGLSPEIAYPLGDSYIQSIEDCRDSSELSSLASAMYHDFIHRVHQAKTNPNYSPVIQKCCDFIELSLNRPVRAAELGALTGYTEYYLTDKFKRETGMSVSRYVRKCKLDRSRILLRSTNLSVQEIAERLAFTTPNYFIQCFREETGLSPEKYRKAVLTSPDPGSSASLPQSPEQSYRTSSAYTPPES